LYRLSNGATDSHRIFEDLFPREPQDEPSIRDKSVLAKPIVLEPGSVGVKGPPVNLEGDPAVQMGEVEFGYDDSP